MVDDCMIGKLARQKAKRLTSLKDYKRISEIAGDWARLENDNGLYKLESLIILDQPLAEKLEQGKKEIAEIVKKKA